MYAELKKGVEQKLKVFEDREDPIQKHHHVCFILTWKNKSIQSNFKTDITQSDNQQIKKIQTWHMVFLIL